MSFRPGEYAYDTNDLLAISDVARTIDSIVTAFICQPRFRGTEAQKWLVEVQNSLAEDLLAITRQLAGTVPSPDVIAALASLYEPYMENEDSIAIRDAMRPVLARAAEMLA